jgi:MoaA/NifB/PqqE/SkfB family radical SAM enzyme
MANLGYIQLARRCNQKCVFCSNPPNGRILSLEQAKEYVDDFVERGYQGIILTGGEPTLFEQLTELVAYANARNMPSRIITNGQKTARLDYLKSLVDGGVTHLHLSIHSWRPEVHDYLTQTPGSLKKQILSLENAGKLGVTVDINCVINKHNAGHLHESVQWLIEKFPFLHHFVWNNLDPSMNPEVDLSDVLHKFADMEVSLLKAMNYLQSMGRTFRCERVPLCYMAEFAHCSTETRKIIKQEERVIHFLDDKATRRETHFDHFKAPACNVCRFSSICAGLFKGDAYFDPEELYPIFLDPDVVRKRVLNDSESNGEQAETPESGRDQTCRTD